MRKKVFRVGDVVYIFSPVYSLIKGTVTNIDANKLYSVFVKFEGEDSEESFTFDGKEKEFHILPSLSFAPYNHTDGGFSQIRPDDLPKVGDFGWFWDNDLSDIKAERLEAIIDNFFYPVSSNETIKRAYKNFRKINPETGHKIV